MRRVLLSVLALVLAAPIAQAADIGIGAFGGISVPIVNDLSKQGSTFGVIVPVKVLPLLTVEPFYAGSTLGDVEESFGTPNTYTRDGGSTSGFGVNALLTFGTSTLLYPYAGFGSYNFTREGSADISEIGYNLGLGFGISPMPKLMVHVRGELNMIKNGETSMKAGNVTVGASYSIFHL